MTKPVKQSRQLAQQYVGDIWTYCWQVRLSYTVYMNVLLRFYLWFNIYFPLLQAHYYTNYWKSKIKPRIKLNHNTYLAFQFTSSYWFCRGTWCIWPVLWLNFAPIHFSNLWLPVCQTWEAVTSWFPPRILAAEMVPKK